MSGDAAVDQEATNSWPTPKCPNLRHMLIIGIILFGMLVGAAAQLLLGRGGSQIDWITAFAAGLGGSFVGGLLGSLLAGEGFALRPSGLIWSFVGAVIVTAAWRAWSRSRGKQTSGS